jgi:hypothetical protein
MFLKAATFVASLDKGKKWKFKKTMLCGYSMAACVLVGDENKHRNQPYIEGGGGGGGKKKKNKHKQNKKKKRM